MLFNICEEKEKPALYTYLKYPIFSGGEQEPTFICVKAGRNQIQMLFGFHNFSAAFSNLFCVQYLSW